MGDALAAAYSERTGHAPGDDALPLFSGKLWRVKPFQTTIGT